MKIKLTVVQKRRSAAKKVRAKAAKQKAKERAKRLREIRDYKMPKD